MTLQSYRGLGGGGHRMPVRHMLERPSPRRSTQMNHFHAEKERERESARVRASVLGTRLSKVKARALARTGKGITSKRRENARENPISIQAQ